MSGWPEAEPFDWSPLEPRNLLIVRAARLHGDMIRRLHAVEFIPTTQFPRSAS